MKKIIRIASVIALASASLLYVGCTKDFSADLAKTNSEVAAQASKVAALEATVQTLNSTVENLKTTKADAAEVNALKEDLAQKINTLTSALEQTALLAASAQADAEAVAADLEVEKARLDTVIAAVELIADASDSLRKDVDSLYKNSADFTKRIAALEGKVEALASRVTSIVAIPSENSEFVAYSIDTITAEGYSTIADTVFTASFIVEPKTAVEDIKAGNLELIIKNGLIDRRPESRTGVKEAPYKVQSVTPNKKEGSITVVAKVSEGEEITHPDVAEYFSLVYKGKDDAGEYAQASAFKRAFFKGEDPTTLANTIKVVNAKTGKAIDANAAYKDTISFGETKDTVFTTVFNGRYNVMAEVNGKLITLDDFAAVHGTKASALAIDTTANVTNWVLDDENHYLSMPRPARPTWTWDRPDNDWTRYHGNYGWPSSTWDPFATFYGTHNNGIVEKNKGLFYKISKTDTSIYYGNRTAVTYDVKVRAGSAVFESVLKNETAPITLTDTLYIGAVAKETYNLGTTSEEWLYSFAKAGSVDKAYTIEGAVAEKVAAVLPTGGLTAGNFTIKPNTGKTLDTVKVAGAKYAKAAVDTTYKVKWETSTNIADKSDCFTYAINWNYKLAARPADVALAFTADTTVRGIHNITFKFDTYKQSILAVMELDNEAPFATPKITKVNGVKYNPADKKYTGPVVEFSSVKDGKLTVKPAKPGEYVIEAESSCVGIKFTYTFTINVVKGASPIFKALTAFIKVEGDKSYSAEIAAPKIDTTRNKGSQGKYVEKLNTMPFNQYFVVDTTAAALENLYATFGTPDTTGNKKFFVEKGAKLYVEDDLVTFEDGAFSWAGYDSLTTNVVAYLVIDGAAQDTIDQVNIKFWTIDPIKSVEHVDSVVSHNPGKYDYVNLNGLFTMKDFVDSTVWANGEAVANRTYEYGQRIIFDTDRDNWTFTGGTFNENQLWLINGSTLVLDADNAKIVNPITVEIPFTVVEDLDPFGVAAADRQGTVKVTFTSEK